MTVTERERQADVQVDERERRAAVLEAAALEIDVRGWCQGVPEDSEGRVCMVAAIAATGGGHIRSGLWWDTRPPGDHELDSFSDWNDVCPDRTAEEVTFVLRWRAQEIRDGR